MRVSSLLSPTTRASLKTVQVSMLLLSSYIESIHAITFNSISSPNLDLSQLGRVGLAGDFDGISIYQFEGQNESGFNTNGSQSLMARFPDGGFATLVSADAGIQAMCNFIMKDGTMAGLLVAGNFTSLGGVETQGIAMFNPNTSTVTPLPGVYGQVSALLCDQNSNTVFIGGNFKAANSTNAIAWVGTAGWTNLPFNGFNGPVETISKAPNGHIIFGGTFTGLGNASSPSTPDQQSINIAGATITSGSSASTDGFSDPKNIICKTSDIDGAGNTWLLSDDSPGFWGASFGFGFEPTKLRLWNTHQDGRGTKTWRYTALPISGIMNFTYLDPTTGRNESCSSQCPLSSNTSIQFQDFHFVNVIGMDAFRIDISDWYGSGGGLDGIELFENDIFAYAINNFNEPTCAGINTASSATLTGPWTVSPSLQSVSGFVTTTITGAGISPASVVFSPDIKQSGNYSVNMYTPGCVQDSTCTSRGRVNITGIMASSGNDATFQTELFQTNNFDKYDQIYFGYIEAASDSFRPSVTLSPSFGQTTNIIVVAQRVGFTLTSADGGLNSIFEFDPSQAVINTTDFATSVFDKAGTDLGIGAGVQSIVSSGDTTFVSGNFSSNLYENIISIDDNGASALPGGGLNSHVMTMFLNGSTLYVGGNFTDTTNFTTTGLNNIAAFDVSKNTWSALGAGLNGRVSSIVPLSLNVTGIIPEIVITVTGSFSEILAFGDNSSITVSGFAIWVSSHNNWLQNLNIQTESIKGQLTASIDLPNGGGSLFAGSLSSEQISANGAVALSKSLSSFPVKIDPTTQTPESFSKRATGTQNVTGVVTGIFYEAGGRNVTVLGGHFTAKATNGSSISNLIFINGSNSEAVTGVGPQLSSDSTVLALAMQGDELFAGGTLSGSIDGQSISGLVSYSLKTATFNSSQPPSLTGDNVAVYAIAQRPESNDFYVGGSFDSAGSLACPGVCLFTTSTQQWNRPGSSLSGTVNAMKWASSNSLIVGGSMSIGTTDVSLAIYDADNQSWSAFNGSSSIPGAVTALAPATTDASQFWIGGTDTNGSSFLMKYDGSAWHSVGDALGATTSIRGLQVLSLSKNHASTKLVPSDETLMVTGSINLLSFGRASAVLYNGTNFQPFALTSSATGGSGSLSQIFTQNQNFFSTSGKSLALGFVVLIGLAIALALIFLIVVAGIFAERYRRKREGYKPAPTNMYDQSNMQRFPPEQMFGTLGQGRDATAPKI